MILFADVVFILTVWCLACLLEAFARKHPSVINPDDHELAVFAVMTGIMAASTYMPARVFFLCAP